MLSDGDNRFLQRCLELARAGAHQVRPNPMVGAVIVSGEDTISEAFHERYGGPHAEALALARASAGVRGATLYCSLEPCAFHSAGKHNAPCAEKIIDEGLGRVVIAQLDPHPRMRGAGAEMLRRAGITVDIAEDDLPFWVTNAAFNTAQALGRPYVHLKWAQSLDGCLATSSGDSKWLSDETARTEAHALRAACDGVLVGSGTLSADNPRLTVRWIEARSPVPLVLDSELSISLDSNLVRERAAELVVLTTEGADPARRAALEERGVTLLVPDGGLTPSSILDSLWDLGMRSVLVEGGAAVISSFLGSELYDRVSVFTAPVFLGGDCVSLGDLGIERVAHAPRLELVTQKVVNDQILTEGFRPGWRRQTHESVEERNVYGAR